MEPFQGNSQINHHLDSQLQSDPSIDTNELTEALAKEFENLVLSCNDEAFDRDLQLYSVPINGQDQNKQPVDDDVAPNKAVIEGESWNGADVDEVIELKDLEKVLEADPEECRVLEEREFGESEIGGFENMNNMNNNDVENESDGGLKSHYYPLRPDAEDCSYYLRTGMCKYGSNCKFNHPLRRNNQLPAKEIQRQREDNMEMHGQIECKYYLSPAGCKYGKSCKFSHGRGKAVITPVVEFNFLGLPIRTGEKECPYYMRNGSCKYGPNCRFNHPDPGAGLSVDAPTSYGNDGPLPLQPPPQPNIPNMLTWSGPRAPDPTAAFVPVMYPPTQNMPPPNPDWNGYQAPAPVPAHVYPSSDRGLPIPPAFFLNNQPSDTNMYTHHQQPMVVSEYPERPGQPDCSYFMKTGDCKYRASCKFHHPKSRITRTTPSVLSDKGLPLRPDQNICTYYSRYGICKYGPSCKYDHPVNYNMNSSPAGGGYNGSGRPGPLIQQSV